MFYDSKKLKPLTVLSSDGAMFQNMRLGFSLKATLYAPVVLLYVLVVVDKSVQVYNSTVLGR